MPAQRLCMMVTGECKSVSSAPSAAAISTVFVELFITASVGEGGINKEADVKSVQAALNRVSVDKGGPNPKLEVDGNCGSLTKSAIGRFQSVQFGWSDCRIDVGKKTEARLREVSAAPPPGPKPETMARVYASLPFALEMVRASLRDLDLARKYHNGAIGAWGFGKASLERVNHIFHLDKYSKSKADESLAWLMDEYMDMMMILGHETQWIQEGIGIFQPDTQDQKKVRAFTYAGGWTRRDPATGKPKTSFQDNYEGPDLRQDAIYICNGLNDKDIQSTASTVVHELAHFVGPELYDQDTIVDWSYRTKPGFFNLTPFMALRTADCYRVYSRTVVGLNPTGA